VQERMKFSQGKAVVGIVAQNSAGYLREAFARLAAGEVVVTLRSEDDRERIETAGVERVVVPSGGTGWVDALAYARSRDAAPAQVLFSSGTEGKAKAVVLSHAALADTTDRLIAAQGLDETVREYVGIPVFYSFGFARARVVAAVGGKIYIPPSGFDPLEIAGMLERGELNAVSAVPSLWRLVLQNRELFAAHGHKLRWIEIGSQYMSGEEKAALKRLFPRAKIVQHYGLTEASRTTFLRLHEAEGKALESVGRPDPGIEVAIGEGGRVKIRGPHVAAGTVAGGALVPLTDGEGWFTTGDIGRLEDGFLYYEGRADDLINCGGVKLSPDALERALLADLGVASGLCVAKAQDALRGEVVLVAHREAIDAGALKAAAGRVLRQYGLEAGASVRLLRVASIPLTETGKPQRQEISRLYAEAEAAAPRSAVTPAPGATAVPPAHADPQTAAIVRVWEEVLNISPVSVDDSFFDLGGDSLSAVSVAMKMEKLGIPPHVCRQIFAGKSIAEIVAKERPAAAKSPLAAANQTIDIVRGLLVLIVIAAHWMPGVVARLPGIVAEYNTYLSPFYSAGTPGFALVFGIGVGFAYLPRFLRSAQSTTTLAWRNAALLGMGIAGIAGIKIAAQLTAGNAMTPVEVSNTFWGALTYYLVAVLSIPLWLRFLAGGAGIWTRCLGAALVFYLLHMAIEASPPTPSENPLVQTGILLLSAKFNYLEMTAGVMVGIATGDWLRARVVGGEGMRGLWIPGVLLLAFAVVLSGELDQLPLWFTWPKPLYLWMWFCYAGVILVLLPAVHVLVTREPARPAVETATNLMAIVGILAFPLYIGHEMVIPLKDFLVALRVPGALALSILVFFGAMAYLIFRLYRVYYSGRSADAQPLDLAELLADRKAD
jgi:acyl-coenzyme A synthetase/AMP-(fatty) acid ligase